MQMPGRNGNTGDYRYGFGGQEKDDEVAGSGNSYTAEHWQYDSRLGRRWNIDPVVKFHESPYAAFANNPVWFADPTGADTITTGQVEAFVKKIDGQTGRLEALGDIIKILREGISELEGIADEHSAWNVGIGATPSGRLGGILMYLHWLHSGAEEMLDAQYSKLEGYEDEFAALYDEYTFTKDAFKATLHTSDGLQFTGEIGSGEVAAAGLVVAAKINLNSNTAKGKFALYQIRIDGDIYKWGLADANRTTKRTVNVTGSNGKVSSIPAGTPVRLKQQERAALKKYNNVQVVYTVEHNVTKAYMKTIETKPIWKYFKKNGYVPDGNKDHANKWKAPRKGKYPQSVTRRK
jgi:RHS repeat-associated protein